MLQAKKAEDVLPAIPIVDLTPLLNQQPDGAATVGRQIRDACLNYGFFFVRNHGVPQSLIDGVFAVSEKYFALPVEEKLEIKVDDNLLGYQPMRGQQYKDQDLAKGTKPNENESFFASRELSPDDPTVIAKKMFRGLNRWPRRPEGFRDALLIYMGALDNLGKQLLPGFAAALGVPAAYFDEPFDQPHITLRLTHYPNQVNPASDTFGIAPHTDYGFMTILATTKVPGLEIKPRGKDWILAPALTDCFLVNTGDLLQRWTNDVFQSTPHRVINTFGQPRYSIPFFFRPRSDYLVDTMDVFVTPERPKRYEPITHAQLFGAAVRKNYAHYQDKAKTPAG